MIWLTWRQFRGSAATMAAVLVVLAIAIALALTGPGLASGYSAGIAACAQDNTCDRFYDHFFGGHETSFMDLTLVVLLTLAAFTAVQLAMPLLVRPHLMPPVTSTFELGRTNVNGIGINRDRGGYVDIRLRTAVPGHAGAWVLSATLVDPSGRTLGNDGAAQLSTTSGPCAPSAGGGDGCMVEINRLGYRQQAAYQPLERFWPFQGIETGIYALLTLGLTWFCFWWIRRRLS